MILVRFSVVPENLLERDPRAVAYRFPESVRVSDAKFVAYLKRLQKFHNYNTLRILESFIKRDSGRYLVPGELLNWRRRDKFAKSKVEVGGKAYFALSLAELTPTEMMKYESFVEEVRGERV